MKPLTQRQILSRVNMVIQGQPMMICIGALLAMLQQLALQIPRNRPDVVEAFLTSLRAVVTTVETYLGEIKKEQEG